MSTRSDPPAGDENVYLVCLAAKSLGLLSADALDECVALLRSLPSGPEPVQLLIDAGLLAPAVVEEARRRLASGWLFPARSTEPVALAPVNPQSPWPHSTEPPQRLGDQFELLEVLGRGVYSTVYRARDLKLGRLVALKVLHAEAALDEATLRRFEVEAMAGASIDHPAVVKVFAVGEVGACRWIAMELVQGPSLSAVLGTSGPLRPRRAFQIARELASALAAAHAKDVIHRDVKPGNVLLDVGSRGDPSGDPSLGHPRLADFGLARIQTMARPSQIGQIHCTLDYAAPEQVLGGPVDARADIYALGATLHHMLAGKPPYGEVSTLAAARKLARDDPEPLDRLVPGLSRDAIAICEQSLRWESSRRYSSASAMAEDIDRFLRGDAVQARPLSSAKRAWRWLRRHPAVVAAVALVAIALGIWLARGLALRREDEIRLVTARAQLALRNPLAALDALPSVLNLSTARGREAHGLAVDGVSALGFYDTAQRLLTASSPVSLRDVIGLPADMAQRVVERHRPNAAFAYYLLAAADSNDLMRAASASHQLAILEAAIDGIRGWGDAHRRLAVLSVSNVLGPAQRTSIDDWLRILTALEPMTAPVDIGAVAEHTVGDLDGDRKPELVTAANHRILVWNLTAMGCTLRASHELADTQRFPTMKLSVGKLATGDIGPAPLPPGRGLAELLVFTHSETVEVEPLQRRFELRALRLQGNEIVAGDHRVDSHAFPGGMHPGDKILVWDADGDDAAEVFIGMGSEATGAKAQRLNRPFTADATVAGLPAPSGQSDRATEVTCLFAGDVDNDGVDELGVGTTAWGGYDLRIYEFDQRQTPPFRLATSRRVGSVGALLCADMDGDGTKEILVATHSYFARNTKVFPTPPHKGELAEGIHVLRVRTQLDSASLEAIASDPVEAGAVDPDHDYRCFGLRSGKVGGQPACLAAWWVERRNEPGAAFLDLYRYSASAGLRRHRIFWSDRHDRAYGHFADLDGDGMDEVIALLGQGDGPTSRWEVRVWKGISAVVQTVELEAFREILEAPALSSALDWFVARDELGTAVNMAKAWFAQGHRHPTMARRWARAAGRARDWAQVAQAMEALGNEMSDLSRGAQSELAMWRDAMVIGSRLQGSSPLSALSEMVLELRSPATPPASTVPGTPLVLIAGREVQVPASSALRLRFEARVERIDFDRHLFVGVLRQRGGQFSRPGSIAAAVNLDHVGGQGGSVRRARPWWNGRHLETGMQSNFEEGDFVEVELEYSPVDREARLRGAAGGREFFYLVPPRSAAPHGSVGDQEPLEPGVCTFGVFAELKQPRSDREPEAVLRQLRLEMQVGQ